MVSEESSLIRYKTYVSAQYQQIFAISQALPGSASMKMLFCINTIHSGYVAGSLAFMLFWYVAFPKYTVSECLQYAHSLPGAIGMYVALSCHRKADQLLIRVIGMAFLSGYHTSEAVFQTQSMLSSQD